MVDGNEVFTTVSIGIAVTTSPDDTADGLLRDADAAMYLAKARGRDRYEIFDEELRTQATERLRTETYLRRAVEMGEIEVYYQPELSLDTGDDGRRRGAGPLAPPGRRAARGRGVHRAGRGAPA